MTLTRTPPDAARARGYLPGLRLLVAIVGAPLSWVAQMSLSEPLAAQSCYPGSHPLAAPALPSLRLLLAGVSGICLLAALACCALAWSNWRITRAGYGQDGAPTAADAEGQASLGAAVDTGVGRTRFLALMGLMTSVLFCAAVLFTALAALLIAPCGGPA